MCADKKSIRFRIVNVFLVLAFVLAGISPACDFISGKNGFIQICASDGSLKTIKVSQDSDLYAVYELLNQNPQNPQNENNSEHSQKQDCEFCFTNSNLTKGLASSETWNALHYASLVLATDKYNAFQSVRFSHFQSRGPPLFI